MTFEAAPFLHSRFHAHALGFPPRNLDIGYGRAAQFLFEAPHSFHVAAILAPSLTIYGADDVMLPGCLYLLPCERSFLRTLKWR